MSQIPVVMTANSRKPLFDLTVACVTVLIEGNVSQLAAAANTHRGNPLNTPEQCFRDRFNSRVPYRNPT